MSMEITAQNYRGLRKCVWTPREVSLLIGANGSGKTTLLRIIEFLRAVYLRGISGALDINWGPGYLRHLDAPDDKPTLLSFQTDRLRWELQLTGSGTDFDERIGEKLYLDGTLILHREPYAKRLTYRGGEQDCDERVGLRMVYDQLRELELEPIVNALKQYRYYSGYNLFRLRQSGSTQSNDLYLHPSGENVFSVLRNWRDRRETRERFQFVMKWLKNAFPDCFSELEFDLVGQIVSGNILEPHREESIPISLTPNGLLVGLLHLTAIAGAEPNSVIAIDEMENALHPYAIRKILEAFRVRSEAENITVCIATHSSVLLDEFASQPDEIFVLERKEFQTPCPLDQLHDREWLAQFSLGRLFAQGEIAEQVLANGHAGKGVEE
jgi:predicted ATPase